jgi:hypothetical protein
MQIEDGFCSSNQIIPVKQVVARGECGKQDGGKLARRRRGRRGRRRKDARQDEITLCS